MRQFIVGRTHQHPTVSHTGSDAPAIADSLTYTWGQWNTDAMVYTDNTLVLYSTGEWTLQNRARNGSRSSTWWVTMTFQAVGNATGAVIWLHDPEAWAGKFNIGYEETKSASGADDKIKNTWDDLVSGKVLMQLLSTVEEVET
jgi:hypothetical protein